MSNPPLASENAAAAAAVSAVRTTDDAPVRADADADADADTEAEAGAPPSRTLVSATTSEQEREGGQEEEARIAGPDLSVPPPVAAAAELPSTLPEPAPPAQQGTPGTVPLAPPATAVSATSHADPVKYARGPAVLYRPHGPSLLTQALATARGIPRQTQPSSPPLQQSPSESHESLQRELQGRDSRHGSLTQADGDSLTPQPSPRKPIMPSSTATSTAVAGPAQGRFDLGEVNSMLNGHREYLAKTKGRTSSFDSTERDAPSRWNAYFQDRAATNPAVSPRRADSPAALHDGAAEGAGATDARPQPRAWKTDQRISIGPEKAWSIGSGETADGQDGQVEKSISEVLAGVEHNTRSRKASHSLRFFKEGLPEEKAKRKDQRHTQPTREKSPSRGESLTDIQEQCVSEPAAIPEIPEVDRVSIERRERARILTPEAKLEQGSPEDYFASKQDEYARDVVPEPTVSGGARDESKLVVAECDEPAELPCQLKPRRVSDLSMEAGESTEEGEESGEEKISSAVFLPHQALEREQSQSPVPGVPQRAVPSRRHSRHDDFHPWLVKADEPEPDRLRASLDLESEKGADAADYSTVAAEVASRQVDDSTPVDECEPAVLAPRLSRPVSQYHEDAVHEHQLTPKQPLEAIELIPYKHQVGGHTTLWRFSRRAVCKQLNNRENEFYEKIEKYHRDLLAFLPRYIGVLNVTFQKQPRRKSTMRRDDAVTSERSQTALQDQTHSKSNGTAQGEKPHESQPSDVPRVVSQSIQSSSAQIPTVTFVDNQHILPRNLLQPQGSLPSYVGRFRSASAYAQGPPTGGQDGRAAAGREDASRPTLQDRHANSWGATTVNKQLRNEVFNDAFLKQPIAIHRHRKGHQRVARRTLQQMLRPTESDPSLIESREKGAHAAAAAAAAATATTTTTKTTAVRGTEPPAGLNGGAYTQSQSDLGQTIELSQEDDETAPKDVTGTSAPEPEILADSSPAQKKKRRYSGTGLRRKPKDVRDGRGDLKYFEEADDAGYKGDREDAESKTALQGVPLRSEPDNGEARAGDDEGLGQAVALPAAPLEFGKIPRPINPKEAQTQRDSRVEYFLLLEDLTAGMKRPCIMDLKMGTRQYGVDANAKKQKSQQGKCAKTTSRELGVRVCGLQVWDVQRQRYEFRDKYYGRELKAGGEFQAALTRFLYDGVDRASILRHIPTVLQKLDELEVIIARLRGYRFYAASLLMFYDGDDSNERENSNYVDDSTTDVATDAEEAIPSSSRRTRRNRREIDFKMADFANCVTAGDLSARDRPCPPRHPDQPDRGFLRGLRSLRRYFLQIQRDTRAEMGLVGPLRNGTGNGLVDGVELDEEDEGNVSE